MRIVDYIKPYVSILDVVSQHTELKRMSATNHVGLCPFHKERSPSFSVNPIKGYCHCYGCGKHGDAIKFLQELHSCTFMEACAILVERFNIPPPTKAWNRMVRQQIREYEAAGKKQEAKEMLSKIRP